MTRSEALIKLLALGDLSRDEVISVMGGDRAATRSAIDDLIADRVVARRCDGYGGHLITLDHAGNAPALGGAHA